MVVYVYKIAALSLSMAPILAILLLLRPVFERWFSAGWRYLLWMALSVRLLIPASLEGIFSLSGRSVPGQSGWSAFMAENPAVSAGIEEKGMGVAGAFFPQGTFGGGVAVVLCVLYVAGVLFFLWRLGAGHFRFLKLLKQWGETPEDSRISSCLEELQKQMGIRRKIPVKICCFVSSPMLVGILKPVLVFPRETYGNRELALILQHELVHLKRRDVLYKMILHLVRGLHWFNPLVHIMVQSAFRDIEISCDNKVLRKKDLEEKKYYSHLILNMAAQSRQEPFTSMSTGFRKEKGDLLIRIRGILDSEGKRKGWIGMLVALCLIAASGSLVTVSADTAQSSLQETETIQSAEMDIRTGQEAPSAGGEALQPETVFGTRSQTQPFSGAESPYGEAEETAKDASVVVVDLEALQQTEADR